MGCLEAVALKAHGRDSLRAEGFDDLALSRLHGPAGLDIGGATAAETAISILAEIVASRHERMGTPLRATNDAIHDRTAVSP